MHYALNCGGRGVEIYAANRKPKLKKDEAINVLPDKTVRIIKLGVKGGKLIGNWSQTQASIMLKLGEPGTLTRVNSKIVTLYNPTFNRVDTGA